MLSSPLRSPLRSPFILPIRYDASTDALLARMTTAPSLQRRSAIDTLVKNLKGSGAWATMDALYVFAAHDEQAAQRNWIADQYNITVGGGTPTFSANSHYVGDGVDDYLDTNFNPTTAVGAKFVQDSAHMGVWHLTDLDDSGALSFSLGNANSSIIRTVGVAGGLTYRPNRSSSNTHSATAVFPGYLAWNRTTSLLFDVYHQGVDVGGASAASAALVNANFLIFRQSTVFGVNQIRFAHWGRQMTAAQVLATYNALAAYNGAI